MLWLAWAQYHNLQGVNDKDTIIKQLVAAPTYNLPFEAATYFCGLLPENLYLDLILNFPPDRAFENYAVRMAYPRSPRAHFTIFTCITFVC